MLLKGIQSTTGTSVSTDWSSLDVIDLQVKPSVFASDHDIVQVRIVELVSDWCLKINVRMKF